MVTLCSSFFFSSAGWDLRSAYVEHIQGAFNSSSISINTQIPLSKPARLRLTGIELLCAGETSATHALSRHKSFHADEDSCPDPIEESPATWFCRLVWPDLHKSRPIGLRQRSSAQAIAGASRQRS